MKNEAMKKAVAQIEKSIRQSGYENTYDFHRRSGVGVSYYTIVRMLDPEYTRPISIPTLIEVASYAGCTPEQIKQILKNVGDKFWHVIMSDPSESMTRQDLALVTIARTITSTSEERWLQIASSMKLIAEAAGVADKCSSQLARLRPNK